MHSLESKLTDLDQDLLQEVGSGATVSDAGSCRSPRYRELVTGILFQLGDSELSGAAGYAAVLNQPPTLAARIGLSRVVMEKLCLAEQAYEILGSFSLNMDKHVSLHCWEARIQRNSELGYRRSASDKRLNALMYPLETWADTAVFTYLMASMASMQCQEFARSSFAPLARLAASVAACEREHASFGLEQIALACRSDRRRQEMQLAAEYWHGRVITSFGKAESERNELYRLFRLKSRRNEELALAWHEQVRDCLAGQGLTLPACS